MALKDFTGSRTWRQHNEILIKEVDWKKNKNKKHPTIYTSISHEYISELNCISLVSAVQGSFTTLTVYYYCKLGVVTVSQEGI